jgi:hypothetical protein
MAPQESALPGTRPTYLRRTVDTSNSSAPAHPSTTEGRHDERPHACLEGWVFITYEDEYGEEREASYPCRRCCSEAAGDTS